MPELITKWQPVSDVDCVFDSISYSFQNDSLVVRMLGKRILVLQFAGVVAVHFEQECPGFDFLPHPLPMLGPAKTFPLLLVEGSEWLEKYRSIYKGISHFGLISSDHLLQLLAKSSVKAHWEE